MLLQASQIFGMGVASLEDNAKVGFVKIILIDKKHMKAAGFIVQNCRFFWSKKFLLSEMDVLDIDRNGVVIRTTSNLVNPDEVVRVKKMIDEKFNLFGMKAFTKNKEYLGKISDFVIETTTLQIVKYIIKGTFEDKMIDFTKVIKVTNDKIIFDDDSFVPIGANIEKVTT